MRMTESLRLDSRSHRGAPQPGALLKGSWSQESAREMAVLGLTADCSLCKHHERPNVLLQSVR